MKILLWLITLLTVVSCDRYQVTFNERQIYTPPSLFTNYQIADPNLRNCVAQAISDQRIEHGEDLLQLNCSYAGITNLSGLKRFSKLETINLFNNQLTDIKPLMFLGSLKRLDLRENPALPCKDLLSLEELLTADLLRPKTCI
ncbi:protein phosphatase 1 regulatory subunit 42 [SAR92 clade bacterium H921]|jgi:hypothetical protein|nr:protein phosphatase 1 regulatory subunit 42 [SAR92 clade bacterium H921]MDG0971471.1 leucine-rich repeat domain-containing protein [Porticoccaceae bacterium]MDG1307704.1 leucine-rich repeat domain-containing protein [Porticoccaceae bacterium]